MRVLITGATGLLGNNLVRVLLEDQYQVTAAIRTRTTPRSLAGLNVDTAFMDLNEPKSIAAAMGDFDVVIHSAAKIQLGWSGLDESRQTNVEGMLHLAKAARLRKMRMILVSTVDALAPGSWDRPATETDRDPAKPSCSYVVSKREAEEAFAQEVERGLDGLIVQPGFMVGPWDWRPSSGEMMLSVAKYFTPLAPSGGCSVVDVRDVACGIVSAIEHGVTGENYILGGHNLSYFDLWEKIAVASGSRGPIGKLPAWINSIAGMAGDAQYRVFGSEPTVNSAATQMGQLVHWYSSSKAEKALGYQIGSIEDALADAWQWFKANDYA